ncbi:MAG: glutamine amidotransferase [Treponema sp.]|nr:glutamine amidotransferase [Treponema sp.]
MKIYLYVLNTLADWEIAHLIAEINSGRFLKRNIEIPEIIKVGNDLTPIKTMGGLEITPDIDVHNITLENGDVIVLPGGNTWQNEENQEIINMILKKPGMDITVAAICGATAALAEAGILDNRKHTSNGKGFLEMMCKNYKGKDLYVDKLVVVDNNLITATGFAPLEFAYEVIRKTNLMESNTLEAWFNLYKTKDTKYFYDLMESLKSTTPP